MVSELSLSLLFPFQWHHVYIPLLQKSLIDFLYAPMPFVIGMHTEYVKGRMQGEMMADLVVVELDRNKVHLNNQNAQQGQQQQQQQQQGHRHSLLHHHHHSQQQELPAHVHHFLPSKERRKLKEKLKPFQPLFSRAGLPTNNASANSSAHASSAAASSTGATASSAASPSSTCVPRPMHQAYQLRLLSELDLAFPNAPQPSEMEEMFGYQQVIDDASPMEGDISLAFFRTFVSLFKEYKEFLLYPPSANEPAPDPCFRWKDFLKKSGYANDAAAVGFFTHFGTTQAFQRFCEERIYAPPPSDAAAAAAAQGATSPGGAQSPLSPSAGVAPHHPLSASAASVLFFDESISAKRNRSKFITKKIPTPFLNDTRWEIRDTVSVPGPEKCGLFGGRFAKNST